MNLNTAHARLYPRTPAIDAPTAVVALVEQVLAEAEPGDFSGAGLDPRNVRALIDATLWCNDRLDLDVWFALDRLYHGDVLLSDRETDLQLALSEIRRQALEAGEWAGTERLLLAALRLLELRNRTPESVAAERALAPPASTLN